MAKIDPKTAQALRSQPQGTPLDDSKLAAARTPASAAAQDTFENAANPAGLSSLLGGPDVAGAPPASLDPRFGRGVERIADAYAARGLKDLAQLARDLGGALGAPARGDSLTELPGTGDLRGGKSRFADALGRYREKQLEGEKGDRGLGMLDVAPRNSHAEDAPGGFSRPTPGQGDLRPGGLASQDGVVHVPATYFRTEEDGAQTAWTHRDGPDGSLVTDMETTNTNGTQTITTITDKQDGTTVVERRYLDSEGRETGGAVDVFDRNGEPQGGRSWSQDPDSAPPNTDDWLVRAMLAIVARIHPPKGDVAMPVHVNPGPEGATPAPEGPRLQPGSGLVINPSPDDVGAGDRPLDADTAERLRGTMKPPVHVNPPGPGEEG